MKRKIIITPIPKLVPSATNGFVAMKNGVISRATVIKYVIPVINAAFIGFSPSSSLVDRYSDAAIESDAAIPVMRPTIIISRVFWRARVRPASAPVSSTNASERPRTIEPMYCSSFVFRTLIRDCSCSSSSFIICSTCGFIFVSFL